MVLNRPFQLSISSFSILDTRDGERKSAQVRLKRSFCRRGGKEIPRADLRHGRVREPRRGSRNVAFSAAALFWNDENYESYENMSLRPNLARLIANIRRCGDNVLARRRSRYRRRENCFHPPPVKRSREYLNEWTNYNLASAALSRHPRAQIREPQTIGPIGDDDKNVQKGGFLVETRETILVIARIAVVISVINILLIVYLITRLTHTSLFPPILRKGIQQVKL